MKRNGSAVTTSGLSKPSPRTRMAASCSRLVSPKSGLNSLGEDFLETGHRRVPAPPHRITGTTRGLDAINIFLGLDIWCVAPGAQQCTNWVQDLASHGLTLLADNPGSPDTSHRSGGCLPQAECSPSSPYS